MNKNKLVRALGGAGKDRVLLRDANDDQYPFKKKYDDFNARPRWKEYEVVEIHPHGLILQIARHYGFLDLDAQTFDYCDSVSLLAKGDDDGDWEDHQEERKQRDRVEDFWDHLPNSNKATYCENGLVRFEDMLVIDDKGIKPHEIPHIFVPFEKEKGPFSGFYEYLEVSSGYDNVNRHPAHELKKVSLFPQKFDEPSTGKVYAIGLVELDTDTHRMIVNGGRIQEFYDLNQKWDFLSSRDVVTLKPAAEGKEPVYLQITHIRRISLKEFMGDGDEYRKEAFEKRAGRKLAETDVIGIFEFKRTYEWKLPGQGSAI